MSEPNKDDLADALARLASGEAGSQGYDLADALVARDKAASLRLAEELVARGEPPGRLVYPIVRRLRQWPAAGAFLDGLNVGAIVLLAVVTFQLGRGAIVDIVTIAISPYDPSKGRITFRGPLRQAKEAGVEE